MHLTESDTRAKHIDPKLKESGWEQFVYRECLLKLTYLKTLKSSLLNWWLKKSCVLYL